MVQNHLLTQCYPEIKQLFNNKYVNKNKMLQRKEEGQIIIGIPTIFLLTSMSKRKGEFDVFPT